MRRNGTVTALLAVLLAVLLGGCSKENEQQEYELVFSDVKKVAGLEAQADEQLEAIEAVFVEEVGLTDGRLVLEGDYVDCDSEVRQRCQRARERLNPTGWTALESLTVEMKNIGTKRQVYFFSFERRPGMPGLFRITER